MSEGVLGSPHLVQTVEDDGTDVRGPHFPTCCATTKYEVFGAR